MKQCKSLAHLASGAPLSDGVGAHIIGVQPLQLRVHLLPAPEGHLKTLYFFIKRSMVTNEMCSKCDLSSASAAGRKPAMMAAEITRSLLGEGGLSMKGQVSKALSSFFFPPIVYPLDTISTGRRPSPGPPHPPSHIHTPDGRVGRQRLAGWQVEGGR